MARQQIGSAKKNLYCHNALILHKSKKLTVQDEPEGTMRNPDKKTSKTV
jgi:hypothetical protein